MSSRPRAQSGVQSMPDAACRNGGVGVKHGACTGSDAVSLSPVHRSHVTNHPRQKVAVFGDRVARAQRCGHRAVSCIADEMAVKTRRRVRR